MKVAPARYCYRSCRCFFRFYPVGTYYINGHLWMTSIHFSSHVVELNTNRFGGNIDSLIYLCWKRSVGASLTSPRSDGPAYLRNGPAFLWFLAPPDLFLSQICIDFSMGITFFPDDTQIRTTEDQAYKRTVYLLDKPQRHIDIFFDFLLHLIYFCYKYISRESLFFPMTPRFEPPKTKLISGQFIYYHGRPQRPLISILFLQIKLMTKYQVSIFHEDHFVSRWHHGFEPTKFSIINGQSIH